MLASTSKQPMMAAQLRSVLLCSSRHLHTSARLRGVAQPIESPSSPAATRAELFFKTDGPLFRTLRRRQESYRFRSLPSPKNPRKADRLEAISLAKSEIRWAVQHVRSSRPSSSSPLDRASRRALIKMCSRMTREHVPLSYLLGSVPFGNLPEELAVRPPVLLPRPETEHWTTEAVSKLVEALERENREEVRVVDLCTGSGCIALLVAHALRVKFGEGAKWRVVACDKSPLPIKLARENAVKLGFKLDDPGSNVHILEADIFDDSDMDRLAVLAGGPFDLILSNPPYIPRREWNNLSPEVKGHEDPAALVGERSIPPSTTANPTDLSESSSSKTDRESYLDRSGLAFHSRLASLLYRPSFSTASPLLPRLVAEYGKGQQKAVEKLHHGLKAPKDRLPKVVRIEGHKLVVVGVGNATTHPNTRHSIGQVVLEPLLEALVEMDTAVRKRLREIQGELEESRREALDSGRIDVAARRDWTEPVPKILPISGQEGGGLDLEAQPATPTSLTKAQSGGWFTSVQLLIPSSPAFLSSPSPYSFSTIYSIEVLLYKPSQPMNLSGIGLKNFLTHHHPLYQHRIEAGQKEEGWRIEDDILVLQDELDLEFGEVKRKDKGSARGHNGIRDIIARLNIPDGASVETLYRVEAKAGGKGLQSKVKKAVEKEGAGPKLSRLRIGIGRPETSASTTTKSNNSAKDSWIPASLTLKSKKVSKPIPIDRWVLSPLKQEEIESCQQGPVLNQVHELLLGWITDRCSALTSQGMVQKQDRTSASEEGRIRIESSKDQFGVYRTVWVY